MTSNIFRTQSVIIVGASSGIGRELAILYANAGWRVGITGRRNHLLQSLQELYPQQIATACFDVTGNENVAQLEDLIERTGGLDLLIYNSGYGETSDMPDPAIDRTTVLTNVKGFTEIAGFAFNYFARQGFGQLAATSSIASIAGNPYAPSYSASKSYMSTYMEGLHIKARKLAKADPAHAGIFITDIQPGFVKTALAKGKRRFWEASPQKAARQIYKAIGRKRFRVYITRRWWLIARLLLWMPAWLRRRIF